MSKNKIKQKIIILVRQNIRVYLKITMIKKHKNLKTIIKSEKLISNKLNSLISKNKICKK